jgi:hypothetical protein
MRTINQILIFDKCKAVIEKMPRLFMFIQRLRHFNRPSYKRLASRSHDLLIEGFPRSSNSFFVKALSQANNLLDLKIATHFHSSAHVLMGVKYNLPVVVLIRNPSDAVFSLLAHGFQLGIITECSKKDEELLLRSSLKQYLSFYKPLLHSKNILFIRFEEVINNFDKTIDKLNKRFSTSYNSLSDNGITNDDVFNSSNQHLHPSKWRDEKKINLLENHNLLLWDEYVSAFHLYEQLIKENKLV